MTDLVTPIVQSVERAPTASDGHTHNFDKTYAAIVQLQNQDGAGSQKFQTDMAAANQKLHAEGLLPNLNLVGVDQTSHKLITEDIADHKSVSQDPTKVNDYGALGSGGNSAEAALGWVANKLGVPMSRIGDGSYNVDNPLDDPNAATKILSSVFKAMSGLGGDGSAPFGMNPLEAAAWKGFPDDPAPEPEPPPEPAPSDP